MNRFQCVKKIWPTFYLCKLNLTSFGTLLNRFVFIYISCYYILIISLDSRKQYMTIIFYLLLRPFFFSWFGKMDKTRYFSFDIVKIDLPFEYFRMNTSTNVSNWLFTFKIFCYLCDTICHSITILCCGWWEKKGKENKISNDSASDFSDANVVKNRILFCLISLSPSLNRDPVSWF